MMQLSHKKWGKLASLGAVAVLSFSVLAACGDKADDSAKGSDTEVSDTAKVNETADDTAKVDDKAKTDDKADAKDDSKVIATYDGGQITENQFNNDLNVLTLLRPEVAQYKEMGDFKNYMLDIQIEYGYLNSKATAEQKAAGEKQADEWIKTNITDSDQKEQIQTFMDEASVTEAQIRDYMAKSFVAAEYYESGVTDADIQKEFDANKNNYVMADVSHILIGLKDKEGKERTDAQAKKLADEVKAKLNNGGNFEELAKQYSDDGSAAKGGELGNQEVAGYVEEFKDASIKQKVGEVGSPVKTQFGYHIIRVNSRTDTLTDEVKEKIRKNIASEKLSAFMDKELATVTKSKEEFATEEVPAAGGAPTDGAATDDADKGTAPDQGAATDKSGEAGTSTETKTDGK
ncbi:hypothetical protein B9G55_23015 [Saccharibacillus sp. O16]|nr:hypothetical protein B9G55_23015 [Saccharibacillus sp. O16]